MTKEIADMSVEEHSMMLANKLKVAGATKFADTSKDGQLMYVSVNKDRKGLVVIERKGDS